MWGWGFDEYKSIAEKKRDAEKQLAKLKKNNPAISPVVVTGRKLVTTWWGTAWVKNLESYADYDNRIGRGRSYAKNGFILDLQICKGRVSVLVQGSGRSPYRVEIGVEPLSGANWNTILETCSHKISGLDALASGQFPRELADLFTAKGNGLFPTPKEIHMDCSCPDWATMCKHVAAAHYGIGARLDENPLLFLNCAAWTLASRSRNPWTKRCAKC